MEGLNKIQDIGEPQQNIGEPQQKTTKEIYDLSTETEQSAILILKTFEELKNEFSIAGSKDGNLTIAEINEIVSRKIPEIEGLLLEMLKKQEEPSEAFKDYGIKHVLNKSKAN